MLAWRVHELNFLEHRQRCEIVVIGSGRQDAFWDATFHFFWLDCPIEKAVALEHVQEWRPVLQ